MSATATEDVGTLVLAQWRTAREEYLSVSHCTEAGIDAAEAMVIAGDALAETIHRLAAALRAEHDRTPATEDVEGRLVEIEERAASATPGPWAWANTCEKGYGANVGAGCYAEADEDCREPLSGDLTSRTDDYYVDQPIAGLDHQNADADAAFIAHARTDVPWLVAALRAERERARKAEEALFTLGRDG